MILTVEIEQQIVDAIRSDPDEPLTLPDHAYNVEGRVIVQVDYLPIDLHRHLHNILIRPLGYHERMTDRSGVPGNVNPYLFAIRQDHKSGATHCRHGHQYEGNEAPPNPWGYRCATCLRELRKSRLNPDAVTANKDKTRCPQGHEYTPENTLHRSGRRRCRICTTEQSRKWARRRRKNEGATP